MLSLPPAVRIFVCTRTTDMRYGFDRLAMLAGSVLGQDPLSGLLFVFFNKRADRCKILFWDRSGFCLWYKRLEQGVFRLPPHQAKTDCLELSIAELSLILEGIDLTTVKRRKRYTYVTDQVTSR